MATEQAINEPKLFLCLHCGAGAFAKKLHKRYKDVMKHACKIAQIEFTKTKCVRSAVVAATQYLENSELINAGHGSSLTLNKTVENDAAILNVNDQKWAAIAAVSSVINPIKAVETIYLKSNETLSNNRISPIFLCGPSAEHWCKNHDVPCYNSSVTLTSKQKRIFTHYSNIIKQSNISKKRKASEMNDGTINMRDIQPTKRRKLNDNDIIESVSGNNHGTCGVIGFDTETRKIYVATSSGGIWMKHPGRIGPSAIIGAGFDGKQFSTEEDTIWIGCCTSGSGEYLMQYRLADKCCSALKEHTMNNSEDEYDMMDENVLSYIFNGFRQSVSSSECKHIAASAGCLVMKAVDNKDGIGIIIHWAHNSDAMGIAVLCDGNIKSYMSTNDTKDKIMISGYHCNVKHVQNKEMTTRFTIY